MFSLSAIFKFCGLHFPKFPASICTDIKTINVTVALTELSKCFSNKAKANSMMKLCHFFLCFLKGCDLSKETWFCARILGWRLLCSPVCWGKEISPVHIRLMERIHFNSSFPSWIYLAQVGLQVSLSLNNFTLGYLWTPPDPQTPV